MSNPHPSRAAVINGMTARTRRQHEEREYRFSEADFLLSCGISPAEIVERLGCSIDALTRQAYRWGRPDLARRFEAANRGTSS